MLNTRCVYVCGTLLFRCASNAVQQPRRTAVQLGNMQVFSAQLAARQPDCENAQPFFPVVTIFDVVQQAPRFLELLTPEGVKALTATCTQLRQDFRSSVTTIQMTDYQDTDMLYADTWPNLVMVVISTTDGHQFGDHINSDTTVTLHERQFGDHAESSLFDRGWSTIMRLRFEQASDDPTNWRSACRQSVALIVKASHQSSPDMDTKAHGSALSRFATNWEAKAQHVWMCQDSKSVCLDSFKHLDLGKWPCLKSITCLGQYDIALPVCWLWGDSSSNLRRITMTLCSLGANTLQSLITTCPHLCSLSLTDCNIEAAALTCLNQARFTKLNRLDLSSNPLGWSGAQSLSRCDLPALQWLNLDDTNLNALAAMYLAQGCWPKLRCLHLVGNQLHVEVAAYLVKGKWPLLKELNLSWTCAPKAAFEVLGVADARKQFESTIQLSNKPRFEAIPLLRSSFLVWPELKALTVCDVICV